MMNRQLRYSAAERARIDAERSAELAARKAREAEFTAWADRQTPGTVVRVGEFRWTLRTDGLWTHELAPGVAGHGSRTLSFNAAKNGWSPAK